VAHVRGSCAFLPACGSFRNPVIRLVVKQSILTASGVLMSILHMILLAPFALTHIIPGLILFVFVPIGSFLGLSFVLGTVIGCVEDADDECTCLPECLRDLLAKIQGENILKYLMIVATALFTSFFMDLSIMACTLMTVDFYRTGNYVHALTSIWTGEYCGTGREFVFLDLSRFRWQHWVIVLSWIV